MEKLKTNRTVEDCLVLIETTRSLLGVYDNNDVIIDQLMDIALHLEKEKKGAMAYWLYQACDNLEGMDCILTGQS